VLLDFRQQGCGIFKYVNFLSGHYKVEQRTIFYNIQGGTEPTDTFQMFKDNVWKQGKISETVYKYVQVCYLLPTDYKLIF